MTGPFDFLAKLAADSDSQEFLNEVLGIEAENVRFGAVEFGHFLSRLRDRLFLFADRRMLSVEFQTVNDPHMDPRVLTYMALAALKEAENGRRPESEVPFVLYIGYELLHMPHELSCNDRLRFSYNIRNVRTIPYGRFLKSRNPLRVMTKILVGEIDDYISVVEQTISVVEQTLQRPESLLHGDAAKMRTYVRYLYELSKLRRMQNEFLPYLMRYGIPP